MTRPIRRARPICRRCYQRPALARVRGKWRVLEHHDVCRQCWRSLTDAVQSWKLTWGEAPAWDPQFAEESELQDVA